MKLTDKILLGVTGALLAYEGWTLVNKDTDDTISESIWRATRNRPLIPFSMGFLMGHFFFQRDPVIMTGTVNVETAEKVEMNK